MNEIVKVLAWDGFSISATHFAPSKSNGKVMMVNSAIGVKQQFYYDFASFFAAQGFHVYTFDYRGIGLSRPKSLRSLKADLSDWALLDVDSMISYIMSAHPQHRIVIAGHSIGGQLIGFSRLAKKAESFILIASQTPYWKNFGGKLFRLKLRFFWNVLIPTLTKINGYFPAKKIGLFEDLPSGVAAQWSRLANSEDYIFGEVPSLKENFQSLDQRALVISFSDDELAPRKAVEQLNSFYTKLRKEHLHISPDQVLDKKIGHFGFFRKKQESLLWREVLNWLNNAYTMSKSQAA